MKILINNRLSEDSFWESWAGLLYLKLGPKDFVWKSLNARSYKSILVEIEYNFENLFPLDDIEFHNTAVMNILHEKVFMFQMSLWFHYNETFDGEENNFFYCRFASKWILLENVLYIHWSLKMSAFLNI